MLKSQLHFLLETGYVWIFHLVCRLGLSLFNALKNSHMLVVKYNGTLLSYKKELNNAICSNPLQYSCLENPTDGGAWWAAVQGVAKSQTRLSDFTFTFHFHALEKAMATHSSVLAWRIPGTGEAGGPPSVGSHRVGHD